MIEQVLEGQPGAGEIEKNLIRLDCRSTAGRVVRLSVAIGAEVFGKHRADQLARCNSSGPRRLSIRSTVRRQAHGVWNLRHGTALHFLAAYMPYTPMNPGA